MGPRQRRKPFIASAIVATASALVGLFYHLRVPCLPEDPPMPDPNSYEDLLYSIGPNRKDDGGRRGPRKDLFKPGPGDLFLDPE